MKKAYFHLPGLFEFYELYKVFLPLFYEHREYFYEYAEIASIYGNPKDCIWAGGRVSDSSTLEDDVIGLLDKYSISARLTFSNSLIDEQHLNNKKCNDLSLKFHNSKNGIIIHSNLLLNYLKNKYPNYYFVSSTTKVIIKKEELIDELNDNDFKYVVPDFRFNNNKEFILSLDELQKSKLEFIVNECCDIQCNKRKECYEYVSKQNLDIDKEEFVCTSSNSEKGYLFSEAIKSRAFISNELIQNFYLPNNISNFKIEGRSLGSALILEFLLYYLAKPEYHINIREEIYLSNTLDLF